MIGRKQRRCHQQCRCRRPEQPSPYSRRQEIEREGWAERQRQQERDTAVRQTLYARKIANCNLQEPWKPCRCYRARRSHSRMRVRHRITCVTPAYLASRGIQRNVLVSMHARVCTWGLYGRAPRYRARQRMLKSSRSKQNKISVYRQRSSQNRHVSFLAYSVGQSPRNAGRATP